MMKTLWMYVLVVISAILLAGCQSKPYKPKTVAQIKVPENIAYKLEGKKYRVWKEAALLKIRNELLEGEYIVFKNVQAQYSSFYNRYLYLGDAYSLEGKKLFGQQYSLADLGVIKFKATIDKNVDDNVVTETRGIYQHGQISHKPEFTGRSYWKTNGGADPSAIPFTQTNLKILPDLSHREQEDPSGLRISCINQEMLLWFDSQQIYSAVDESVTVTVFAPYKEGRVYKSTSLGHKGVWLPVDSYMDDVLRNSEAIKLSAFSNANHRVVEITAFNNGLSEAYARVKNICNKSL